MEQYWDGESREGYWVIQELLGIPNSIFKTKGELLLTQQEDIKLALRGIENSLFARSGNENQAPRELQVRVDAPEIHFNADVITGELSSGFDRLVEEQVKLREMTAKLGLVWLSALGEHRNSNRLLEILWKQGAEAFEQRNVALGELVRSIEGIQGAVVSTGLGTSHKIDEVKDAMLFSIAELWIGIAEMSHEEAKTRFHIVEAIKGLQWMYLWFHKEKSVSLRHMADQQRVIVEIMRNPRAHASEEEWRIGELCRIAGDAENAKRMFETSLDTNPANPRPRFSLGMLAVSNGDSNLATEWFDQSALYAKACNLRELSGFSKLHSAKMAKMENELEISFELLDQSLVLDVRNFETWYEAATVAMLLGKHEEAKQALYVLIRYSPAYRLKVLGDPVFYPVQPTIHELSKKYS